MSTSHLGKLQLAIMRVLWSHGESTVTDVHRALEPSHGLAPTTIATMLKKMEGKGVVTHRTEGRRFIYRATVSEDAITRSMVADLKERLFDGSAAALVSHLLRAHEVDDDELAALRRQLERAQADAEAPTASATTQAPSSPSSAARRGPAKGEGKEP
jgi:BlaI family transcriptional regulator, penicillinase repressor